MRKARWRRWRSDRASEKHHDVPDVGFVAGVGALGAAFFERAQDPAPVALDEEPDAGFPARPGSRTAASRTAHGPGCSATAVTASRTGSRSAGRCREGRGRAPRAAFLAREKGGGRPFPLPASGPTLKRSPQSIWNGTRPDGRRPLGRRTRVFPRAPSCPLPATFASARPPAPMLRASSTNTDAESRRREPLSWDAALHVRLHHSLEPPSRSRRGSLSRHRPLLTSAAQAAARRGCVPPQPFLGDRCRWTLGSKLWACAHMPRFASRASRSTCL